jgi:hypothetical protein
MDIPTDIIEAALKVETWMKRNGHNSWELLGLCSRDHANKLKTLRNDIQCACNAITDSVLVSGNDPQTTLHFVRKLKHHETKTEHIQNARAGSQQRRG